MSSSCGSAGLSGNAGVLFLNAAAFPSKRRLKRNFKKTASESLDSSFC